ncbi:hypothetical protein E2562_012035 [Oryza meyeriana var. granulata]|uniref:Ethylene insensitive 3-like DNA-binding domain-containing protein n=1 Tax=Oryza meyeriana var. granulata TaxID=110450 RepID=A0A6G1D2N0_9ORYZ|nr:hypothetical protein E2562_012035 [Oryza meyeriana var. granulata]
MKNAGGSGGGAGQAPPPVVRSPLATAVARLEDHVLECMVKVLMKKCYPPQEVYPLIGKSPMRPPWWPELGAGAVAPPYRPASLLSKAEKEVAVVAMVKNIAPDFERLAMAMQMAPSVTSIITDVEARAWEAGVTRERDAYVAAHPRAPPPTRAWSLMGSLKPEAVRMKRKPPKPPHACMAGELVLLRIGRKKGGVEIFDEEEGGASGSGGPTRGRIVIETYERIGIFEPGNGSGVAIENAIYQNAGAEMSSNLEAGGTSRNPSTVLQPNAGTEDAQQGNVNGVAGAIFQNAGAEISSNLEAGGSSSNPGTVLRPNAGCLMQHWV